MITAVKFCFQLRFAPLRRGVRQPVPTVRGAGDDARERQNAGPPVP